jgi:hypothetical protein
MERHKKNLASACLIDGTTGKRRLNKPIGYYRPAIFFKK